MLFGYGGYSLAFAISSTGGGAAFLSSSSALTDGRTGSSCSMKWDTGVQSTSTIVSLTVTPTSPLDPSNAPWGVVGVSNVQGLPEGTKLVFGGVTQRLTKGPRGELGAWWIPNDLSHGNPYILGGSHAIQLYNDVNGSATIAAGATFSIGEVFVGRVISLPSLVASQPPSSRPFDTTANTATQGGQNWQLLRKIRRQYQAHLGYFSSKDVKGGSDSTINSGGYPYGSTIDVQTLLENLLTTQLCAVCDTPSAGNGAGSVLNGIRYDQDFMQSNWIIARPTGIGEMINDQSPLWSVVVNLQEAT